MKADAEKSHLNGASPLSYRALLCVTAVALVVLVLIIYPSEIRDAIWLLGKDKTKAVTIPYLPVTLHNDGSESILLPLQGQCLLWPPEQSWDYECGFEFKQTDGADPDAQAISLPPKAEKAFRIHVTKLAPIHQTQTSLARILSAGDWHIQFITHTDQNGGTRIISSRIPFTAHALSSGYRFEVSLKPHRR